MIVEDTEDCGGSIYCVRPLLPVWLLECLRRLAVTENELLQTFGSLSQSDLENAWRYCNDPEHAAQINRCIQNHEEYVVSEPYRDRVFLYLENPHRSCTQTPEHWPGVVECTLGLREPNEFLRVFRANLQDDFIPLIVADLVAEGGDGLRSAMIRAMSQNSQMVHLVLLRIPGEQPFSARFRRGFAESVRLPLAVWRGHGVHLFRDNILNYVEITDRCPMEISNKSPWPPYRWIELRERSFSIRNPAVLPPELFNQLPTDAPRPHSGEVAYGSQAAALTALSTACLAWAGQ